MRYLLVSVIISIGIGLFGCKQEQNAGENTSLPQHVQVRNVIIDADTDNELDDLLAIAAALKSPKLEVIGMTAAQWDGRNNTVREGHDPWWNDNSAYTSWLMNAVLVQLLDRTDLPLPVGSERKIVYKKGSPENNPRRSEATDFIIRKASDLPPGEKLTIISTGALTNVASAVMVKPEIAKKIALYWLGQTYDFEKDVWIGEHEFNVANDLEAFDLLCDAEDLEFHIMPNNVSGLLRFHNAHSINKLEKVEGIGTFIADRWRKRIGDNMTSSWTMWDVALVYAITNPKWAEEKMVDTPPGTTKRKVDIYTNIDAEKMENEFWNALGCNVPEGQQAAAQPQIRKVKDVVIYEDPKFHATFPSAVKLGPNEYTVAFRRAPDRRVFGEPGNAHVDPNSYLVQVHSNDGENWTKDPELIYAHPFGGSQDPCLLQLKDGTLLCASYGWAFSSQEGIDNLGKPVLHESWHGGEIAFLGGYILRSFDKGKTWEDPIIPPTLGSEIYISATGEPLPTYNRGAMCEGKNGKIYWIVAGHDPAPLGKTSNHLLVSEDKGETWQYSGLVATDDSVAFNEASVYETPKGDIVGFLRTTLSDHACIARSTDGGKTFEWKSMQFQGHPLAALRLPDNRVLLTYGYRHKPFGIRARILNAECTDYAISEEFILRDDGDGPDLGYPWPIMLEDNRVLVVYYYNKNGHRNIEGTILDIDCKK